MEVHVVWSGEKRKSKSEIGKCELWSERGQRYVGVDMSDRVESMTEYLVENKVRKDDNRMQDG